MQFKSNIEHVVNGGELVGAKVRKPTPHRALRLARQIFGFVPTVKHKFSVTDKTVTEQFMSQLKLLLVITR